MNVTCGSCKLFELGEKIQRQGIIGSCPYRPLTFPHSEICGAFQLNLNGTKNNDN